jgi:sigma-B regulation protein RsbU (phosphoserine phosphatase)
MFEFRKQVVTFANSGLPYPIKCTNGQATQLDMPGVPLGSFAGSKYEDFQVPLAAGDVFVLCSDGLSEAFDETGQEFGAARVIEVVERTYTRAAKEIVDELFLAVQQFCGDAEQSDDRTAVVVKINQLGPPKLPNADPVT